MPSKQRHHQRKKQPQKKGEKLTSVSSAVAAPKETVSQYTKPIVPQVKSASAVNLAGAASVKYPFVVTELRRIGILAGIILVILIILSFVL